MRSEVQVFPGPFQQIKSLKAKHNSKQKNETEATQPNRAREKNTIPKNGAVAQLEERLNRIQEVVGSIPSSSIKSVHKKNKIIAEIAIDKIAQNIAEICSALCNFSCINIIHKIVSKILLA